MPTTSKVKTITAWGLFCQAQFDAEPDGPKRMSTAQWNAQLSARWKALTEEEKQPYYAESERLHETAQAEIDAACATDRADTPDRKAFVFLPYSSTSLFTHTTIPSSKARNMISWAVKTMDAWHEQTGWSGLLLLGGKDAEGKLQAFQCVASR